MEEFTKVMQEGVTAFHVVAHVKDKLLQAGFQELNYAGQWKVEQGGSYVITPFPTMLVAISIGSLQQGSALRLAAAHTDFPCIKIKMNPEMPGTCYVRMNVEPYGSLLKSTWFDRPLGIAGKLVLKGEDAFHPDIRYIKTEGPLCIIPSLAPHLEEGKEQKELDPQREMIPVIGLYDYDASLKSQKVDAEGFLLPYLEQTYGISRGRILDYDLFLYNTDQPETLGLHQELISAPRIDNLASVSALLEAMEILSDHAHSNIAVAAMFDNEEIGSRSKQGADSILLRQILEKLGTALGMDEAEWKDQIAKGFLLSMDGAQGFHPNYPEKSDPTNPVYLGKGIVIKTSASQRFLSDSVASGVLKELCQYADIPYQQQVNRSGMPGGWTLGPILSSYLPMLGADVGIPMLAMHSARELAACADYRGLVKLAEAFYQYPA